jgi:ssDNA-binding Zn-finger/Zn-ribbon topoisomerase 1
MSIKKLDIFLVVVGNCNKCGEKLSKVIGSPSEMLGGFDGFPKHHSIEDVFIEWCVGILERGHRCEM